MPPTIGVAWIRGNSGRWLYQGGLGGLAVLGAVVLVVVTTQPTGRLHGALSVRPLVAIGVISYGVYLYHWPLFLWLSPERTHLDGLALFAVRVVVTFGAATCVVLLDRASRTAGVGGRSRGVPSEASPPRV